MLVGAFPGPAISRAAEVTEATLLFASGQSAAIVSGGAIDINITKPDYYVEDTSAKPDPGTGSIIQNGLNIKMVDVTADLKEIQVGGQDGGNKKTLNISDKFFQNPDVDAYTADLDISGAYKALLKKGSVVENGKIYYFNQDDDGNPVGDVDGKPFYKPSTASSSFTIDPQISVFQTSTIELLCTESENDMRAPAFSIGKVEGDAFSGFTAALSKRRSKDTDPLQVVLRDATNHEYIVTLSPETIQTMDENGYDLGGRKRWVQKDTVFQLSMPQAKSNNVLLKVYSPKAAANQIALDIKAQNGEDSKQDFIKLAEGDTLEFIRQNFSVAYDTTYFNTQFYLTWEWKPNDPQYQNTIRFPTSSPSGFQTVQLDREYDDVEGKLLVKISCRLRANPVLTEVEIPVIIKGTGRPATLEAHSQKKASTTLNPVTNQYPIETIRFEGSERAMRDFTLDAYDGRLAGVKQPLDPSALTVRLNMGLDNASSLYAVVECSSGGGDLVTMKASSDRPDGSTAVSDYTFGGQLANPYAEIITGTEGVVDLTFLPQKIGVREGKSTTVTVTFYVKDAKGKPTPALEQPSPFKITVKDSSPSDDATLSKLLVIGQVKGGFFGYTSVDIDYGFQPATFDYNIEVENKCEKVILEPTVNDIYFAGKTIRVKATTNGGYVEGWGPSASDSGGADGFFRTVKSGSRTPEIPLIENQTVKVQLVVTAEDTSTQIYNLSIMRKPKSTDATLKSLSLTGSDGKVYFNGIKQNVFEYDVALPFKVQKVKVAYETNDSMAAVSFDPELEQETVFSEKVWLNILKGCANSEGSRSMDWQVNLKAEEETSTSKYVLHITRTEPSNVNTLKELKVLDASEGKDTALTLTPAFKAGMEMGDGDAFELHIPYSTSKLKVSAKATDTGSTVILLADGLAGGGLFGETESGGSGWMVLGENSASKAFVAKPYTDGQAETSYYTALVEAWPESMLAPTNGNRPQKPGEVVNGVSYEDYMQKVMHYPVHIYREPASREAALKSIELADQDQKAISFLDFDPEKTDYTIEVPYEVSKVSVKPTAVYDRVAKIEVGGKKVESGTFSSLIKLEEKTTQIKIVVYPEYYHENSAAATKTYTLTIVRLDPSSDSRLVKLEVANSTDFKPVFAPSKTSYSAKVAEGAEGVKITATANHPAAKIEIDGVRVESGKQTDLIRILELSQKVTVVVTAQDGKSVTTYTIRFRNENLIEKTSNADLEDLEITPGSMRPLNFKPSLLDYEVSVDEETYDVELFPVLSDSLATMKVYQDSREIGDDDDNYSGSIQDGENEFTIEVTSPDGSKQKTYTVLVYRNEEDKMGKLDPLTADEIDFKNSSDIIVVDITKYSRIAADVFEELRTYPDKTIVFQGNDYSIQIKAKDLGKIVPNTDYFDFGMSFSSPLEEEIENEITSYSGNGDADLVYVYFKYHGALPAPATLTLSLGKAYRNDRYYWNYYNEERGRIDYYGTVNTNSKGTFTVPLEHMSTYVISDRMLAGAENKTGQVSAERDLTSEALVEKLIPNTGAEETS